MGLLEIIGITLLILWFGGLALHIAGGFIHILLVVGLALLAGRLIQSMQR